MAKNFNNSSFTSKSNSKYRSRSRSPERNSKSENFIPFKRTLQFPSKNSSPWVSPSTLKFEDPLLKLHEEIIDFFDFMQPTESERKEREGLVQRIKKITKNLWPQADVFVFGSFETGLWLPNSDVDIVVLTYDDTPSEELIKTLAKGEILEMADEMDLITSATVPILKFKDRVTEIYVDVCFNTENGVQGAEIVKALLAKYPEAKYLVCVFKYFLKQRALNDTYSGGIGSFLLFCMVIASIQQHPSRLNNPQHFHRYILSHYLVFFLKFFGEDFKYDQNGISILDEGSIFRKSSKRWTLTDRSNFLTVECPQKPGTDLGRCSFAIETVKKAFSHSYRLLCSQTKSLGKTPLSLLIRLDETIESRGNLRCYKGKN